jgi:uncharacterized protein YjbI with pentapeptide repeats
VVTQPEGPLVEEDLRGEDLTSWDLTDAVFERCLRNADLSGVRTVGARFVACDLAGDAELRGARLDLAGAVQVTTALGAVVG